MSEYQGRLSCTWMAAKVCHKVQVVMHDPQGASKDVQGSPSSGLPLGLSGLMYVFDMFEY